MKKDYFKDIKLLRVTEVTGGNNTLEPFKVMEYSVTPNHKSMNNEVVTMGNRGNTKDLLPLLPCNVTCIPGLKARDNKAVTSVTPVTLLNIDSEDIKIRYEEIAGIFEYKQKLPRDEAERLALIEVQLEYFKKNYHEAFEEIIIISK